MGPWWSVLFLYGHGQFSSKLFDALTDVCTTAGLKTGDYPDPEACQPLLDQVSTEVPSIIQRAVEEEVVCLSGGVFALG